MQNRPEGNALYAFKSRGFGGEIGLVAADTFIVFSLLTNPVSPPNPLLLNAYSASLLAVTVPMSTNGHKTYHLLDGMNRLILI